MLSFSAKLASFEMLKVSSIVALVLLLPPFLFSDLVGPFLEITAIHDATSVLFTDDAVFWPDKEVYSEPFDHQQIHHGPRYPNSHSKKVALQPKKSKAMR